MKTRLRHAKTIKYSEQERERKKLQNQYLLSAYYVLGTSVFFHLIFVPMMTIHSPNIFFFYFLSL